MTHSACLTAGPECAPLYHAMQGRAPDGPVCRDESGMIRTSRIRRADLPRIHRKLGCCRKHHDEHGICECRVPATRHRHVFRGTPPGTRITLSMRAHQCGPDGVSACGLCLFFPDRLVPSSEGRRRSVLWDCSIRPATGSRAGKSRYGALAHLVAGRCKVVHLVLAGGGASREPGRPAAVIWLEPQPALAFLIPA